MFGTTDLNAPSSDLIRTIGLSGREGMTKAEADKLGIRDAVSFQTGNVLIQQNGEDIKLFHADSDTGTAQRTAIGQRADGTVILLVTDGRSVDSIGAQETML